MAWRVMELSPPKANLLDELGLADEKGQLAGNSITGRMATEVASEASRRVAAYQNRRVASRKGLFATMTPNVRLQAVLLFVVYLVVFDLTQGSVLSWGSNEVPGLVGSLDQQATFNAACNWADGLGYQDAESKCILLGRSCGPSSARAVIYYGTDLEPTQGATWVQINSILGEPLGELAVASLARVQRMTGQVLSAPMDGDCWRSGRVAGTAAYHPSEEQTTAKDRGHSRA